MAAIKALKALKKRSRVDLHTDSQYVRKGITEWIHGWKKRGWKTAARKPVKNSALWKKLDEERQKHEIEWYWVKGHAGDPLNERADELAGLGMHEARNGKTSPDIVSTSEPAASSKKPDRETESRAVLSSRKGFELHKRLADDTLEIMPLDLCSVRLMNDHRYPWLVLVPMCQNMREIIDLSQADSLVLMREIRLVSAAMGELFAPQKLNIATLGNLVEQLHVHIVARHDGDPAWPGPVWNNGLPQPYEKDRQQKLIPIIRQVLHKLHADHHE